MNIRTMCIYLAAATLWSWAAGAEAYPIFSCRVTRVNRAVMNFFGDVKLEVYRSDGAPSQPDAILQVEVASGEERTLHLGRSSYTDGNEFRCREEQLICYSAASQEVEVGYILKIDIVNGGKGELLGYPTNLPGRPNVLRVAKAIADVRCQRVAP